ncbi:Sodium-coupled monocarboxylate transporter 2 [Portunus trituberculatus]|uniref:Sodium-coupled monocarboxylate transporter 2 n=1 Tax=Portunus trituberculatus TaxID=210409 RepID=A0A5B7FDV8_PORTR|nr:Sodium-coupled monocarboxylate transporter 2 [Portunus trituberculatus]
MFYVSKAVSGAIMGPLVGIFVAGIFTPWANTKSVVGGFVVALIYNIWIVVGKFLYGGGSPKRLPLSTEGCPENLFLQLPNTTTTLPDIMSTVFPTDALNTTLATGKTNMVLVVRATGPLRPGTVDARLVCSRCAKFHEWVWNALGGSSRQTANTLEEKERGISLLPSSTATPS